MGRRTTLSYSELPSKYVSPQQLNKYLHGLTEDECDEIEDEFNAWCDDTLNIDVQFKEFMDNIYKYNEVNPKDPV